MHSGILTIGSIVGFKNGGEVTNILVYNCSEDSKFKRFNVGTGPSHPRGREGGGVPDCIYRLILPGELVSRYVFVCRKQELPIQYPSP